MFISSDKTKDGEKNRRDQGPVRAQLQYEEHNTETLQQ